MRKKDVIAMSFVVALSLLITPAFGIGPQQNGNSGNFSNDNEILDVFKGQGKRSGLIKVNRTDLCSGEEFTVAVVLPSSLSAVWSEEADVQMVIRLPDGQFFPGIPVDNADPDLPFDLFSFDLPDGVPEGNYQFALILTSAEGGEEPLDPWDLRNWYNGFSGLISVKNVRVRVGCISTEENGEGNSDGETEALP